MDAVSSAFEISPFVSMAEFVELEDFILSHSEYEENAKKREATLSKEMQTNLYYYMITELRT